MLVREGTAGQIYNSIVIGFGREAVVIDQAVTTRQIDSGDLVIANNIFGPNRTRESQRSQFAAGIDAGDLCGLCGPERRLDPQLEHQ